MLTPKLKINIVWASGWLLPWFSKLLPRTKWFITNGGPQGQVGNSRRWWKGWQLNTYVEGRAWKTIPVLEAVTTQETFFQQYMTTIILLATKLGEKNTTKQHKHKQVSEEVKSGHPGNQGMSYALANDWQERPTTRTTDPEQRYNGCLLYSPD